MSLSTHRGTLLLPNATGNQATTGVGFQPKVLLLYVTTNAAEGFLTNAVLGFGAAVSSTERKTVAIVADDNQATSDTARRQANLAITLLSDATTPTVFAEADHVSMDADGFTLNWTTVPGVGNPYCHFIALGGTDLANVKVGEFVLPTSTNATYGVTGVGFQPDAILVFGLADETALPASTATGLLFLGAATSSSSRAACSYANRDNRTDTELARFLTATKVIHEIGGAGAIKAEADLVSMDTDGFTLNVSTAPAVADRVFYVALKGPRFKVGVETQKTSTGTKATTGVGFQPDLLFLFGVNRVNSGTIDTTSAAMGVSIGAGKSGTEGCVWFGGLDAAATSDEGSNLGLAKVFRHATAPSTVDAEADLSSLDADGFTLDWTTADATAREFIYLGIGPTPTGTSLPFARRDRRIVPII